MSVGDEVQPRAIVEGTSKFRGEAIGWLVVLTQFRDVICRCKGSVLPKILVELVVTFSLGWLAYYMHHDVSLPFGLADAPALNASAEQLALEAPVGLTSGHSMLGFLLGFLIVFRTQSGFNFYLEALNNVTVLRSSIRSIGIEILGSLPREGLEDPEIAELVLSVIRRLKLYYYAVVEHLRSNDSYSTWLEAHAMVLRLASDEEIEEFEIEFGAPTRSRAPHPVPDDVDCTSSSALLSPAAAAEAAASAVTAVPESLSGQRREVVPPRRRARRSVAARSSS